ncbi:MAG: ABC transporter substrate-binding protein [Rhodospirillales bacterium]|jgi:peptide/nickel transport system substrate-binding protein|nr:ABC transporter substrate-binding protein [Rhodospirillales bacterium]
MGDVTAMASAAGRPRRPAAKRTRCGHARRLLPVLGTIVAAVALLATPAAAQTFKWAAKSDALTLDPHGANEAVTLGLLANVYDGLTRYDERLDLQPALATSWQRTAATVWTFHLRRGVHFHDGSPFTADDVIFSWRRASGDASEVRTYARKVQAIRRLDDHTIEIATPAPNPLLPRDLAFLYVMNEAWSRRHHAEAAAGIGSGTLSNHAGVNTNGTGPFRIVERRGELSTTLQRVPGSWRPVTGNAETAVMTPIAFDGTRVAAILSGSVDAITDVPIQDWRRIDNQPGIALATAREARTLFLGFDQSRDELLYASVQGANPFKDRRVRAAFAHAIDVDRINEKVMGAAAWPAGLLVAPEIVGFSAALNQPYAHDLERARALLAEAGYGSGFSLTLDCPNNRFVNDERICLAVAAMLAKIGISVEVRAVPKARYFARVLAGGGFRTSFFLMGWVPTSFDSHNVLFNLAACRDLAAGVGQFNIGGYCNPEVDELTRQIEVEMDADRRQRLIETAFARIREDVGFLPLFQPPVSLAVRRGITVVARPDNILDLGTVVIP